MGLWDFLLETWDGFWRVIRRIEEAREGLMEWNQVLSDAFPWHMDFPFDTCLTIIGIILILHFVIVRLWITSATIKEAQQEARYQTESDGDKETAGGSDAS